MHLILIRSIYPSMGAVSFCKKPFDKCTYMHYRRVSCWSDKCFTLIYVQNACSTCIIMKSLLCSVQSKRGKQEIEDHPLFYKEFSFSISQLHSPLCSMVLLFVQSVHTRLWHSEAEIDIDIKLMAKFHCIMQILFKTNFNGWLCFNDSIWRQRSPNHATELSVFINK